MIVPLRGGAHITLSRPMFLDNSKEVSVIFNCIELLTWISQCKLKKSHYPMRIANYAIYRLKHQKSFILRH